jgi:predicted transcriptional regulator
MENLHAPKSEALRALFWRDEILQVMFWLKGEGLGETVDPAVIERFLGVDASIGVRYLDRLVDEGLLDRSEDGAYRLTEKGETLGARGFAEEFSGLTRPAHGECGPDCWCHASPEEAEACAAERLEPDHDHD